MSRPIPAPVVWDETSRVESRRLWAAIVLALDVDVCCSILVGRPVLARSLDALVLRHALRGELLPDADSYFRVRVGHLDAICEADDALVAAARRGKRT